MIWFHLWFDLIENLISSLEKLLQLWNWSIFKGHPPGYQEQLAKSFVICIHLHVFWFLIFKIFSKSNWIKLYWKLKKKTFDLICVQFDSIWAKRFNSLTKCDSISIRFDSPVGYRAQSCHRHKCYLTCAVSFSPFLFFFSRNTKQVWPWSLLILHLNEKYVVTLRENVSFCWFWWGSGNCSPEWACSNPQHIVPSLGQSLIILLCKLQVIIHWFRQNGTGSSLEVRWCSRTYTWTKGTESMMPALKLYWMDNDKCLLFHYVECKCESKAAKKPAYQCSWQYVDRVCCQFHFTLLFWVD